MFVISSPTSPILLLRLRLVPVGSPHFFLPPPSLQPHLNYPPIHLPPFPLNSLLFFTPLIFFHHASSSSDLRLSRISLTV